MLRLVCHVPWTQLDYWGHFFTSPKIHNNVLHSNIIVLQWHDSYLNLTFFESVVVDRTKQGIVASSFATSKLVQSLLTGNVKV